MGRDIMLLVSDYIFIRYDRSLLDTTSGVNTVYDISSPHAFFQSGALGANPGDRIVFRVKLVDIVRAIREDD